MSLRFFSDHCVPMEIVRLLRKEGHEVLCLRDVIPIRSLDAAVIAAAQKQGCILLSLNGDFADVVAYPPADYHGVIAIQLHNHPEVIPQLMNRFIAFLKVRPDFRAYWGKLFLVEAHRIRIRQ